MRIVLTAAAIGLFVAAEAHALSFTTFSNDAVFNDRCAASSGFGGAGGNQTCEIAVGEFRSGDNGGTAERELGINIPRIEAGGFRGANGLEPQQSGETVWGNGVATPFIFMHDGAGLLTLNLGGSFDPLDYTIVGGQTLSADLPALATTNATVRSIDEVESLFLRTNYNSRTATPTRAPFEGFASLTGMTFWEGADGTALPDNVPAAAGSANAAYVAIGGVDFAAAWALTGLTTFGWNPDAPNIYPRGSALNHNFKLTDLNVIPLPAAGWLLLSAVGGLAALGRWRSAT